MALSATVLSGLIKTGMLANPATQAQDNPALQAMCDAIAAAVVAHIVSAAVVAVTGVTTGAGAAAGTIS